MIRGSDDVITIDTLGDFDIRIQNESILHSIGNQTRLIKLFKYFLTFEGRKILPDKIIDEIWQGDESKDPLNVLRTQICRIRTMFNCKKDTVEPFFEINYIDGYYLFQLNSNCNVDFLMMESLIKKNQISKDKEETMDTCKKIIELYKGEYLGELGNDNWVVPIRSRYSRLFISSLTKYLQLLSEISMDNQIISICEHAMGHIPYEELIHIYYIQSLANLGQIRCALNHYTYYTSKIYNELGAKPSNKLVATYKSIKIIENQISSNIVLGTLDNELKDCDDHSGALICDNFYFKFLYNFKYRTIERNKENVFVGIITIDKVGYGQLSQEDTKYSMLNLLDITYHSLRKGDVITQWNQNQILLLLLGLEEENLFQLIERLKTKFSKMIRNDKVNLNIKFQQL